MKNGEKIKRNEKSNKNKLLNNKFFTPIQLKKIENIFDVNSSSNKTAIILYKKSQNKNILLNHNKDRYNNIKIYNNSKSREKKNKTLNNTYHRKNKILNKAHENKKNKILRTEVKSKIISEFKMLNNRIYSPLNKSTNKNHKINFSTEKRNKTPIKNINNCLINNKFDDFSPSNKINKNKKSYSKNRNKNYDYNFKTFYNDKSNHKTKINSIYEKRKGPIPKEKSFIIKRNKSFNKQNQAKKSKPKKHNTSHIHRRKSNDVDNIKFDEFFNTFNNTHTHKKEINSYSYYNPNNSTTKKNNKKIEKENKPHVDTLEYLTKIINSKKPNKLSNIQNEIKNNKNTNKNQETFINAFRKKNNEKKRLSNEKSDIKKYIQVKKKLYKLNNIKKKKKEKEEELKKYLELYKLERNISNSNNNTFYHSAKTQNVFNATKKCDEYNDDDNYVCNNNNNEFLSSIDSTIVDKNNFYEGIIDIQKIYSNNIINNNIIINNYPKSELNSGQEKNITKYNKKRDDINNNHQINKKINSRNQKEPYNDNLKNNEIMIDNKIPNIKNELKEEKIDEITFTYSSPQKEEKKETIKEEEIENKKEIIKPEDDFNKANVLQINELNEYSFRLNNSNSESNEAKENNEMNSFTTSKFCNSQLFSEQNSQSNKNILLNEKELKEEEKEEEKKEKEEKEEKNNINEKNILQETKKYSFTKEELDNYKEILSSLFDYLKLITQRNALNDIISYGDMKYKYKIGFEIILTLIKLAPFNIIRAIQQTQYYHFAFRQLFIPYITKCFRKLKLFCYYGKLFETAEKKLKFIYKKILINKIKRFNRNKNFEEINEILNLDNKNFEILSDKDISESKENDLIDWEDSFFSDKQDINNVISENDIVNMK